MMSTIYNRVNDQTGTPQAKNKTVAARDELIPALTLREVPTGSAETQPQPAAIHLVRALLKKG
jgi:hypothetical protein